jgi:hypothetical protein
MGKEIIIITKIFDFVSFSCCFFSRPDGNMHASTHSNLPDGSDKFFTIDESYCPTIQNHPLNFDDVIRKTILYYVENVRIYQKKQQLIFI